MVYFLSEIIDFVAAKSGCKNIKGSCDIDAELGCYGDDFHELMKTCAESFNVDMSSYLWYFHTGEEGNISSIGGAFFKSPDARVKRIPVTPDMLLEFANKGKWDIEYPSHTIPKRRYDIWINLIILIAAIGMLVIWFVR